MILQAGQGFPTLSRGLSFRGFRGCFGFRGWGGGGLMMLAAMRASAITSTGQGVKAEAAELEADDSEANEAGT